MAGRETVVGDGLVAFDDLGFVIGVVKDGRGDPIEPPRALSDHQIRVFEQVKGLAELSPTESRRVPLDTENRSRRGAFLDRVTAAAASARRRNRRWPSVRQTQPVLQAMGHPRGRKEKIAAVIEELKQAEPTEER